MFNTQLFAYAAQEHSTKYGSTLEQCAKIAYKNHKHSVHNPYACLRKEIPLKYISESKTICKPITLAMSAPTADGSAAAVVCSRAFMESRGMQVSLRTGREIFNTLGSRIFFCLAAIGCLGDFSGRRVFDQRQKPKTVHEKSLFGTHGRSLTTSWENLDEESHS